MTDYQVMPPLGENEYRELKEDIEKRGVMVPVEYDENGNVLDGHHRIKVCQELGITVWPRLIRQGMTDNEKRSHALMLNLARRHLTNEQRKPLWVEMRQSGMTLEAIAKADGTVSKSTIHEALKTVDVSDSGNVPPTITDTKGRKQPTKKPRKKKTVFVSTEVAEKAQSLPTEQCNAVLYGEKKPTEAVRQVRNAEKIEKAKSLPEGKYHIIYVDPPWQYRDKRQTGDHRDSTGAEDHYPTMSLDEMKALNVKDMAAKDCVLFCWATFPLLPDALEIVKAWGFTYKTAFVWDKGSGSFGHYHNAAAELLLIGTRGSGTPQIDKRENQVQAFKREGHSRKPDEWRKLIDKLYPVGPRVELFRRGEKLDGWEVWGNESE